MKIPIAAKRSALALCVLAALGSVAGAAKPAAVTIHTKPDGGRVSVDGDPVGTTPTTKSLAYGAHVYRIDVEWPDGSSATKELTLTSAKPVTLLLEAVEEVHRTHPQVARASANDSADAPMQPYTTPSEATPLVPAPPHLTLLPKPIPSPLHPRNRMTAGTSLGAGVYCPNLSTGSSNPYRSWCSAQLRLSMDGPFADMHAALLLGDQIHVGGLIGFEMGSRYMQLGHRQRLAVALRGSFDLLIAKLGASVPGQFHDGLLGFSNTYGPHFSVAMNPRVAIELKGAVGWTVSGFWSNHEGFGRDPVYGFVAEGWIGVRFAP